MMNRTPARKPMRGNVLIDLQKDMFMDDIAPTPTATTPALTQNGAANRLSLNVSGACDDQTNDLEQRIVEVINKWKKTLKED